MQGETVRQDETVQQDETVIQGETVLKGETVLQGEIVGIACNIIDEWACITGRISPHCSMSLNAKGYIKKQH